MGVCERCGAKAKRRFCSHKCYWESKVGPRVPLEVRFWSHVDENGPVPPHRPELGPCWMWTAARIGRYKQPVVRVNRKTLLASRVAWELKNGPIPDGKNVLHHCDNSGCVNNETHLFLGTKADNTADMMAKGRHVVSGRKVSDDGVREIRRLCAAGESQRKVAARFGVSSSLVGLIVRGDRRRHC